MIYLTKNDWQRLLNPKKEVIEAREKYLEYLDKNIQTEELNGEYFIYSTNVNYNGIRKKLFCNKSSS